MKALILPCGLAIFVFASTSCVHTAKSEQEPQRAQVSPSAQPMPTEIRVQGQSERMIVQEPCAAEEAWRLPVQRPPQIEAGLQLTRKGDKLQGLLVTPFTAYRCNSH